ncbi:enoyl-CoA hydratase/isomerase family protein [Sutcliffiella deserti]|uniref:enoyl-CoA hydratase/isomerase family protein n=1 Tax=Sutcliffiella deserti TaxID=2875501 RepID=UPI001CBD0418|nr:enoyl-CoA hydratase/isomerase family protein [Sutcliffiella deserti]
MDTQKVITYKDENNIYWFQINRPNTRNAIDYDVMNTLQEVIETVKKDPSVRALIITGAGNKSFCSGGDLSVFHALYTKEEAYHMLSKMANILYSLMVLPLPTYAILNGTAIGGGCEIATACDYRWATNKDVKLGFVQGNLGITTGWGGASMLFEKMPIPIASRLLMSSKIFSAEEGEKLGFIQEVLNSNGDGIDIGEKITNDLITSPQVLRGYKEALVSKWNQTNLKERIQKEVENCSVLWEMDEHHEAVAQFLQSKKK